MFKHQIVILFTYTIVIYLHSGLSKISFLCILLHEIRPFIIQQRSKEKLVQLEFVLARWIRTQLIFTVTLITQVTSKTAATRHQNEALNLTLFGCTLPVRVLSLCLFVECFSVLIYEERKVSQVNMISILHIKKKNQGHSLPAEFTLIQLCRFRNLVWPSIQKLTSVRIKRLLAGIKRRRYWRNMRGFRQSQ